MQTRYPDFRVKEPNVGLHLDEESEDVNRIQEARVPINVKLLREDTARGPVLSRVMAGQVRGSRQFEKLLC